MARVRILVTNDDGIASPGIHAVAAALGALGDVWIVAPDRERTAVGHAVTLHKPLRITKMAPRVFMVNGTPVDCVNLALVKILPGPPAMILSGINRGVNLGDDVMYSGTVSGALEGTILGIPSVAVSQEGGETFRFEVGARYAARVVAQVLQHGLPAETILNVNIPDVPLRSIKGVKVTCLSRRRFNNPIVEKVDPRGRKYYWIAGTRQSWSRKQDADHEALERRMVSVTPIHLDTTYHAMLEHFKAWEQPLSKLSATRSVVKGRSPKRSRA
ncbi:MAG: 5'-nucleotidase SurE [Nitrospira sp.]|nr:5'/3'-nucleotidase SurE [Nitrospira sp.]ULA59167.1 MAG: 5'-nucleotidase SurE [Nitrospira sp.]